MPATHPVAQILYQRRNEGSLPGTRTDGYRVGVVVEGGGMRGIISGAMMATLIDCGLEHSIDAIYAISAGAFNSIYFLANLGWYGLSIYYENLLSRVFLDISRLLRGQPIMSLEYVVDVVMEIAKPLNYADVLASPIELHIVASSIQKLKSYIFTHFASAEDLKIALKASAWLPFIAGPPLAYDGDHLLDGDILLSHPILLALESNCTHILFLRTSAEKSFRATTLARQRLMAGYLQRLHPDLGTTYLAATGQYWQLQQHFREIGERQDIPPFILEVACPAGTNSLSHFSQNRDALVRGLFDGHRALIKALDPDYAYPQPTVFTSPYCGLQKY